MSTQEFILIIKLGALGDFIIATSAFAAIRHYHPYAHIVLLTTKPYVELAEKTGYFDEVWMDARPPLWQLPALWKTIHLLRGGDKIPHFKRIYDLQANDRTAFYFWCLGWSKPQWVGKVQGCSHPRLIPDGQRHVYDIFLDHLTRIGFPSVPLPDVSWLDDDISSLNLPDKFLVLVPGASPRRPKKRWTAVAYAEIIRHYHKQGISSVIVGGTTEVEFAQQIESLVKEGSLMNAVGKTSLGMIAALGRKAVYAIGSDTGPMHIIAAAGCPVLVLFSCDSDPKLHGPRGEKVQTLQVDDLRLLEVHKVLAKAASVQV